MKAWGALLAIAVAGATFLAVGQSAFLALRYERDALLDGEIWRAVSGHVVHVSWAHLGLNVAVAALVAATLGRHIGFGAVVLCVAGTSAGLFLFSLGVKWYAGLSGVLHGLIVVGALEAWRRDRRPFWLAAVALVAMKVAIEQWKGAPAQLAEVVGAPVIVEAHLYGAISGALAFAILYRPSRSRL
jgi:rhomboid family GlyGly-CTERM serine protease